MSFPWRPCKASGPLWCLIRNCGYHRPVVCSGHGSAGTQKLRGKKAGFGKSFAAHSVQGFDDGLSLQGRFPDERHRVPLSQGQPPHGMRKSSRAKALKP